MGYARVYVMTGNNSIGSVHCRTDSCIGRGSRTGDGGVCASIQDTVQDIVTGHHPSSGHMIYACRNFIQSLEICSLCGGVPKLSNACARERHVLLPDMNLFTHA